MTLYLTVRTSITGGTIDDLTPKVPLTYTELFKDSENTGGINLMQTRASGPRNSELVVLESAGTPLSKTTSSCGRLLEGSTRRLPSNSKSHPAFAAFKRENVDNMGECLCETICLKIE